MLLSMPIPVKRGAPYPFSERGFGERRLGEMVAGRAAKVLLYKFAEKMEEMGFGRMGDCSLLKPNEVFFNRGLDSEGNQNGKSNFFVLARVGQSGALEVHFTNPDYGAGAGALEPAAIQKVLRIGNAGEMELEPVLREISDAASKKHEGTYFAVLHGHWGSINGVDLFSKHIDDGESPERNTVRQMILYNIDYDGTGHHNHIVLELLDYLTALENVAGIVKIPSCELTLPYRDGKPNGPHHNIWLASREAAGEYVDSVLSHRESGLHLPSFAPSVPRDEIISINDSLRKRGLAAVGIAHPACDMALPAVGLLNRVGTRDYTLEFALEYVRAHADAIGAFNITLPASQQIRFVNKSDEKYFRELLGKWGLGAKLFLNSVNMAFALEMGREGKWGYADHDIHNWLPPAWNICIRGLGRMENIILPAALDNGRKPDAAEIVGLMLGKGAKSRMQAFIPYKLSWGSIDIVPQRRNESGWDRVKQWFVKIYNLAEKVPTIWHDFWKRGAGINR